MKYTFSGSNLMNSKKEFPNVILEIHKSYNYWLLTAKSTNIAQVRVNKESPHGKIGHVFSTCHRIENKVFDDRIIDILNSINDIEEKEGRIFLKTDLDTFISD